MNEMIIYAASFTFCWLMFSRFQVTGEMDGNYVGCFVDIELNQKLEPVLENQENLTIEICIQKCYNIANQTKFATTFAALNNGRGCICRNNFGQQLPDINCNVKCSGDQTQNCGGNKNYTLYSLYSVCELGHYGFKCDQVCHCRRRSPCDRMTGQCPNGCEAKWFGPTCNNARWSEKYIGCFRDNQTRAISPRYHFTSQMTVESCTDSCILRNNSFIGLQARGHCFCGESYAKYGTRKESDCSDPCNGNRYQKCGGAWANSVYFACPVGFYGRNCVNQCHCSDGGSCRFNGSCLNSTLSSCKSGWTGSACNIRDCGLNNGDCASDEKCETVDLGFANLSMCRCKVGSYRDNNACRPKNCGIKNGNCKSDEKCETVDLGFAKLSTCRCKDGSTRDNNNTCRPSHLRYVGCYNKGNATLYYPPVELSTSDAFTVEFCILKCRQLDKTYSWLQGGVSCLCGDDYGQAILDAECQVPCAGNKQQYCGGRNTVNGTSIYAVYTAKSFFRQYMGCYKDNIVRSMDIQFFWEKAGNNSVESCIRHCASLNYPFAGLQHSFECFCGNSYDKYGPLPESGCNRSCSGNKSQMCGGLWANNVYAANDIFWCSRDSNCKQNEACNVIDLKYANVSRCRCKAGFHRMSKYGPCTDFDECQMGTSTCNVKTEICVNHIGSHRCECKNGFENKSGNCEDKDECRNVSLVCDIETELCTNTIGSYTCHCKPGYEITIFGNCTDVDECISGELKCNPSSENCLNTNGSYKCECKDGFVNTSGQCKDMDECKNDSPVCNIESEICQNTIGSYLCHCKTGFENTTSGKCTDIDECQIDSSSPCNAFSECFNGIGSYTCRCKESFACGKYEGDHITEKEGNYSSNATGIILGTFLAISLLINALFAVYLVKNARNSEFSKGQAQSNSQRSPKNDWEQQENIYEGRPTPEPFDQDGISEEIVLEKRQVIFKSTSQYALLTQDD